MKVTRDEKSSGITLVALVVTVILVIIIAGVAISLITGENGLFSKANQAATIYNKESQVEKTKFDSLMNVLNGYGGNAGNGGNPNVAQDTALAYQYGGLATIDEINTDMFVYTTLTEPSGTANGTARVTDINWDYFAVNGQINDWNDVARQISKLVIPYEVTISGNTYDITELEKFVIPPRFDGITTGCPWYMRDRGNLDTSLAAGSSANGTTIQKFSYLIIPSSVRKVIKSHFSGDAIPRDHVLFSPNSQLTEIGNDAFSTNTCFEEIIIPNGCTKIGNSAFYDCSALSRIYIPKTVTEIEDYVFDGYSEDELTIYYEGSEDEWDDLDLSFDAIPFDATILYNQSISDMQ